MFNIQHTTKRMFNISPVILNKCICGIGCSIRIYWNRISVQTSHLYVTSDVGHRWRKLSLFIIRDLVISFYCHKRRKIFYDHKRYFNHKGKKKLWKVIFFSFITRAAGLFLYHEQSEFPFPYLLLKQVLE